MLDLHQIKKYYPASLHGFSRLLLREYLQCKILDIIYRGPYAHRFVFLGGTCLRLVHGNQRFSEDLDFDLVDLQWDQFQEMANHVADELMNLGHSVEIRVISRGAFHCFIRFPSLLYQQGLSGYAEEKILIQIDSEDQQYNYEPERPLLNRFDVFTDVLATPLPILMAQKCYAILNRKRNKGRDFFDLVFLMGLNTQPDWNFLYQKLGIGGGADLKNRILAHCESIDMKAMASDVEPFLFRAGDEKKVLLFTEYLKGYSF